MLVNVVASAINGALIGTIYGIAATGLTLIFGVMGVINLMHGATIALGMFALYYLVTALGINPYVALAPVLVGGFVFGVCVYWVAVHRALGSSDLMTLLATFAVNLIIIGLGTIAFSTNPYNVPFGLPGIDLLGYTITGAQLVASAIAVALAGALYALLYFTRPGKAIRAVSNNIRAAELMGINTRWILAISFGLGIAIAAAAGLLIATLFPFTILGGAQYELKSFVVVVLGGLGNPLGALIGGILLGIIEGVLAPFIDVSWTPAIEFGLFVVLLVLFPQGLLLAGRKQ